MYAVLECTLCTTHEKLVNDLFKLMLCKHFTDSMNNQAILMLTVIKFTGANMTNCKFLCIMASLQVPEFVHSYLKDLRVKSFWLTYMSLRS